MGFRKYRKCVRRQFAIVVYLKRIVVKPHTPLASLALLCCALATGCSKIHPEERAALQELESVGADIELTEQGRAKEINLEMRSVTDEDLVHLEDLVALESLDLSGTDITDAGLVHVSVLTNLTDLNIGGGYQKPSNITDAGLVHLEELQKLEQLVLSDSKVTDAGLTHLRGLENLESLYLFQTNVTDAGLAHLEGLQSLEVLRVGRTGVTLEGAKTFQAKMPNLKKFVEAGEASQDAPDRQAGEADQATDGGADQGSATNEGEGTDGGE